jgi:hypothetical protein
MPPTNKEARFAPAWMGRAQTCVTPQAGSPRRMPIPIISQPTRDNPTREDFAESFLPYLAVRHRPDRISSTLAATIANTIPNRLAYFDALNLNWFPVLGWPLQIGASNPGTFVISWSSPSSGWGLQKSSSLGEDNWTSPPEPISDNGTLKSISIGVPADNRFFRLER